MLTPVTGTGTITVHLATLVGSCTEVAEITAVP